MSAAPATAVVIGTGANELVCAHYLARAGLRVTVLQQDAAENSDVPVAGWVPPAIVRDLALHAHGFTLWQPDPWMTAVTDDGDRLELWNDVYRSAEAIRRLSAKDAERWPVFCERMRRLTKLVEHIYISPPLDPLGKESKDLMELAATALRVRRLGRVGIQDLMRVVPMSAADLLEDWFENDALKGALASGGIMHLRQGPRSGGTAALLLHHHVGSPCGVFRPPSSNIRTVLARMPGVEVRAGQVRRIEVRAGRVSAVALESGEEIAAPLVISGAAPRRTLLELLDPAWMPAEYVHALGRIRCRGVAARLALTLDRPTAFARFTIAPSLDYLERAYDDSKYGRVSKAPYIEATRMNDGNRVDVHLQYAPHALADGAWNGELRARLIDLALEMLSCHVPDLGAAVSEASVLVPPDLEELYGWPEGQVYHAEPALDQTWWMRPIPGWARYGTPVHGLYLCGPATHPASVAGTAGYNAARQILRDCK